MEATEQSESEDNNIEDTEDVQIRTDPDLRINVTVNSPNSAITSPAAGTPNSAPPHFKLG